MNIFKIIKGLFGALMVSRLLKVKTLCALEWQIAQKSFPRLMMLGFLLLCGFMMTWALFLGTLLMFLHSLFENWGADFFILLLINGFITFLLFKKLKLLSQNLQFGYTRRALLRQKTLL